MARNYRKITVANKLEAFNWFWRKRADLKNLIYEKEGNDLVYLSKVHSWIVTCRSVETCYQALEDSIAAYSWKPYLGKTKNEAIENATLLYFHCSPEELWLKMAIEKG